MEKINFLPQIPDEGTGNNYKMTDSSGVDTNIQLVRTATFTDPINLGTILSADNFNLMQDNIEQALTTQAIYFESRIDALDSFQEKFIFTQNVPHGNPVEALNFDNSHILYFDAWWDNKKSWDSRIFIKKINKIFYITFVCSNNTGPTASIHSHAFGLDYSKYRLIFASCWIYSDGSRGCGVGGPDWQFMLQNAGIYKTSQSDQENGFFGEYVNGSASPQACTINLTIREL